MSRGRRLPRWGGRGRHAMGRAEKARRAEAAERLVAKWTGGEWAEDFAEASGPGPAYADADPSYADAGPAYADPGPAYADAGPAGDEGTAYRLDDRTQAGPAGQVGPGEEGGDFPAGGKVRRLFGS
jgi:hypothetical protein